MIKNIFFIIIILNLFSCQTQTKINSDPNTAIWILDTKAQITDKTNDSTHNVSIEIFLKKNSALRMEVTALMGYQVGSLLMTKSLIQYAVHPKKLYIQGPISGKTLKPLFKQDIDPIILWTIIHNESLKSRGFQCVQTGTLIETCKNNLATVEIEQRGEIDTDGRSTDGQKKITLESSTIKMVWIFKSVQTAENESQSETFVLNRPKEYKLIHIK